MIGRRGLFRGAMALVGGGAAASLAGSMDANPNIGLPVADEWNPTNTPGPWNPLPKWFYKLEESQYSRPKWGGFDLDLHANKSMSYAAKAIIQRRRDKERRSWLEKMREKAMKEVGLS